MLVGASQPTASLVLPKRLCLDRTVVQWIVMAGLSAIEQGWQKSAETILAVLDDLPTDPAKINFFKALMLYGLGRFSQAFEQLAGQTDDDNQKLEQLFLQEFRFPPPLDMLSCPGGRA